MKISPQWLREFVDLKVEARELANDLTLAGTSVESVSGEGDATIFEMEITTNRPDCMNHYGVARECSAIYDLDLKPLETALRPSLPKNPAVETPVRASQSDFKIEIEDPQGCARYTARIIRNVTIKASPAHAQKRLESLDARPINNAADATNYNLIEMGHPTHAFDLDLLEGGKIVVRRARDGEKLKTLDGVERTLTKQDLVIADAKKAVAIAGVMGGFDTMITEKTKNVLVESAWFDPASIRATAKRHGMHTDASHRFERGADWGATPLACSLVCKHIIEWGGGELEGEIDAAARSLARQPIQLSRSEVRRILGQDISDIERILTRLGFGVLAGRRTEVVNPGMPVGSGGARAAIAEEVADWAVTIPTWRLDVEREIDVIEEIARIHGYNKFPNTLPSFSGGVMELPEAARDAALRSSLLGLGYNEAIAITFISHADAKTFGTGEAVELENPLNEEMSVMRNSLAPSMLNMLANNLNRGSENVRLFEAGNVYELVGGRTQERKQIAIGASGLAEPPSVHGKARPYSFFDLKGDVEALLSEFQHDALYFDASSADYYHPGRSARAVMDGATVAKFGQLHRDIAAARKLKQDVYIAELYLDRLYGHPLRAARYQPLSKFPAVGRDFSFLMDDSVRWESVRTAIDALKIDDMRSFVPVEIFRGGAVPAGKYSILMRATFQSDDRTLRDDEVAAWSQQIIQALGALGGTLRA